MRTLLLGALVALPVGAVVLTLACTIGSDDATDRDVEDLAARAYEQCEGPAARARVALTHREGGTVDGIAWFTQCDDDLSLYARVTGLVKDAASEWSVRAGDCSNPGAKIVDLPLLKPDPKRPLRAAILRGAEVPGAALLGDASLCNKAVVVHDAGGASSFAACGIVKCNGQAPSEDAGVPGDAGVGDPGDAGTGDPGDAGTD